jgi:hypothetical protein
MRPVSDHVFLRLEPRRLDVMMASRRVRSSLVKAVNCSIFITQGLFITPSDRSGLTARGNLNAAHAAQVERIDGQNSRPLGMAVRSQPIKKYNLNLMM